jgi:hypothetical protein
MSFPTREEVNQKARDAEYAIAREQGLIECYRAYPVITRDISNDRMIEEICSAFIGDKVAPTLAVFRSAVEERPSLLGGGSGVHIQPIEVQKRKVLAEIEELLTGIMSPLDLKSELGKLQFWSVEQVIARKQQIVERQRLSKMAVPQIKQELEAGRPKLHRYHPYDQLPDITAADLKKILRTHEARVYLRRFGSAQLNDRLLGRF